MTRPLVTATKSTRSGPGWRFTIFGVDGPVVSLWGTKPLAAIQRDAEAALARVPLQASDAAGPMGERP